MWMRAREAPRDLCLRTRGDLFTRSVLGYCWCTSFRSESALRMIAEVIYIFLVLVVVQDAAMPIVRVRVFCISVYGELRHI